MSNDIVKDAERYLRYYLRAKHFEKVNKWALIWVPIVLIISGIFSVAITGQTFSIVFNAGSLASAILLVVICKILEHYYAWKVRENVYSGHGQIVVS